MWRKQLPKGTSSTASRQPRPRARSPPQAQGDRPLWAVVLLPVCLHDI